MKHIITPPVALLPVRSSAPAAVRGWSTRRLNARARRLSIRTAARADRAARIAAEHAPAPAVCITPDPWRRAIFSRLARDMSIDRPAAGGAYSKDIPAHTVTVYKSNGIYTGTPAAGATPVSINVPAHTITGDITPAYRRPVAPYSGTSADTARRSEHPGLGQSAAPAPVLTADVTSTKRAKEGCKASYSAQHQISAPTDSPLMSLAWGCAVNVVKYRIQDTMPKNVNDAMRGDCGFSKFTDLYYQAINDSRRITPARAGMPALLKDAKSAAADLANKEKIAKDMAKINGLTGFVRKTYIDDQTAAERAALKMAKERVRNAEKIDTMQISDFADIQAAAYLAGLELAKKYAAYLAKDGKSFETVDCQKIVDGLLALQARDSAALKAARAEMETAKSAAKSAGITRWLDFAPYRTAKEKFTKYRNRAITAVMCSAARVYIGSADHGGRCIAADIDGAARRSEQVQSAENAALYAAVNRAAKEDSYHTTAAVDLLKLCPSARSAECLYYKMQGYTQAQIAAAVGCSQKTVSNDLTAARAAIAAAPDYSRSVQVQAYRAAIAAALSK